MRGCKYVQIQQADIKLKKLFTSDNKDKYPTETKHPNDNININIIGRVIKNLSRGL